MKTVSARIDEEILREVDDIVRKRGVDRSEVIRELLKIGLREYRLREALELVREKRATLWRAAELAGVSYREMLEKLRQHNIPFPLSKEELLAEIEEVSSE